MVNIPNTVCEYTRNKMLIMDDVMYPRMAKFHDTFTIIAKCLYSRIDRYGLWQRLLSFVMCCSSRIRKSPYHFRLFISYFTDLYNNTDAINTNINGIKIVCKGFIHIISHRYKHPWTSENVMQ